jgi:hypothetical protein
MEKGQQQANQLQMEGEDEEAEEDETDDERWGGVRRSMLEGVMNKVR